MMWSFALLPGGAVTPPSRETEGAAPSISSAMMISALNILSRRFGRCAGSFTARSKLCSRSFSGSNIGGSRTAKVLERLAGRTRPAGSARLGCLRQRGLGLGIGPVEPLRQRIEVGLLHRRTAPDAKPRRRVAIGVDVVGDAFLLERGSDPLDELRLRVGGKLHHHGIHHLEADRGVGADRRIDREMLDPRRA